MTVSVRNPARERLAVGELSLGIGVRHSRAVDVAMLMHTAGFDWLFLDLEHGPLSLETTAEMSVAALAVGIAPLVRVPRGAYSMATRALDSGALGIVMPHVDTAAEAREVVDHLRFPPEGHRSVAGGPPQLGFRNVATGEMTRVLNAATLVVVMLETPQAIDNAEAIAAVPGVDALLIGTNDLTTEMGRPGDFAGDAVVKAYERVIAACRQHGKFPGMGGVYSEDLLRRYIGLGMRLILCGNDGSLLLAAATQRAGFVRGVKG